MGLLEKAQQKKGQSEKSKDLQISQTEKTVKEAKSLRKSSKKKTRKSTTFCYKC